MILRIKRAELFEEKLTSIEIDEPELINQLNDGRSDTILGLVNDLSLEAVRIKLRMSDEQIDYLKKVKECAKIVSGCSKLEKMSQLELEQFQSTLESNQTTPKIEICNKALQELYWFGLLKSALQKWGLEEPRLLQLIERIANNVAE